VIFFRVVISSGDIFLDSTSKQLKLQDHRISMSYIVCHFASQAHRPSTLTHYRTHKNYRPWKTCLWILLAKIPSNEYDCIACNSNMHVQRSALFAHTNINIHILLDRTQLHLVLLLSSCPQSFYSINVWLTSIINTSVNSSTVLSSLTPMTSNWQQLPNGCSNYMSN